MKKKIIILGSTGSIGSTTVDIINKDKTMFNVILLSANKNYKKIFLQAKKVNCKNLLIYNKEKYFLALSKNKKNNFKIYNKMEVFLKTLKGRVDYTMCSITGIAGLKPTVSAIKFSHNIAIANKESIICGWNLIEKDIKKYKTRFIPIDSEHFSIWSLIGNSKSSEIQKIFITASGGPFLNLPIKKFKMITPNNAIKHPKWVMGKKISVDSSTLMNKVFEVIEAQRIFKISFSKFKILIHPNSYVHAIVKFTNGITKILLHDTNMKIPIFNSLYSDYKNKKLKTEEIDFEKINNLNFMDINYTKFPSVNILKSIPNNISLFETVLISANDCLVELFLEKKIKFLEISKNLKKIIELKEFIKLKRIKPTSINEIIKLNRYVALKTRSLSVVFPN